MLHICRTKKNRLNKKQPIQHFETWEEVLGCELGMRIHRKWGVVRCHCNNIAPCIKPSVRHRFQRHVKQTKASEFNVSFRCRRVFCECSTFISVIRTNLHNCKGFYPR